MLLGTNLLPRDHFDFVALMKQWHRRRKFRDLTASGYNPFDYTSSTPVERRFAEPVSPMQEKVQDLKAQISTALSSHEFSKAAELYLQMKKVDGEAVLSRQAQLEVANQL